MRAPAMPMLLLLAGLLAGVAEGYSVKVLPNPAPQQHPQVVVKDWPGNSKEILEDDTDDDPDYVPDYDEVYDDDNYNDLSYEVVDGGYSTENDINNQEGGGSFIASEETEGGKLWLSDEDPDWTPSGSQEDERYKDDDSQDSRTQEYVDSLENDIIPSGVQPFPEVVFPGHNGVVAEYGSHSQQDSLPVKNKRNVKRSYQVSQLGVQVPQQMVKVSAPYGSEQDGIDSGTWGSIQEGSGVYPGVSTGVEPVQPVGGPQQHEVGEGVEPEQEGVVGDRDKESSGSSTGGWFREGWRRFTGAVENLGDQAEDTFRSLGDKVEHAAGRVHETLSEAVDKLHQTYDDVRRKLPQILERFKALILKFGVVIQEGARYCLWRFEHAVDQVRESQVIEKLEKELQEGHAEVAKFFQILGEKVQAWRDQHSSSHVDAGLIDGYEPVNGQTQLEEGPYRQDIEDMPDFFQEDQVIVQLNKLKEIGVLTDEDVIILTQEHVTQNQQNQHQDQQNQNQNQNLDSQQQNQQQNYNNQQQSQNPASFIQFPE